MKVVRWFMVLALPCCIPAVAENPVVVSVTTDAAGDWTGESKRVNGKILYIHYQDGFADTADIDVSCTRTGEVLWDEDNVTAAKVQQPAKQIQDANGADLVQYDYFYCPRSTVTITVAQGGDTQTAVFEIAWGDS